MNHPELILEYKKQLARVFGTYPNSIDALIDGMGDDKLKADLEILRGYPSNIPAIMLESQGPTEPSEIIEDAKRRIDFDSHSVA